jgi:hypothetical protein
MILAFLVQNQHFKNFLDTTSTVFCRAKLEFADVSEELPTPSSRLKTEPTSLNESSISTQPHKIALHRTADFTAISIKTSNLTQGASEKVA